MAESERSTRLAILRQRLAALEQGGRGERPILSFGLGTIDRALPGGGLACGVLHEVAGDDGDAEDGAVATGFLAGILARLQPSRPVLWCLAQADLYAPGLALHGLAPERLIVTRAGSDREILWAMEEGLKCPALAAVVGEVEVLSSPASRRLQLAAEATGITVFALRRRFRSGGEDIRPLAAVTRWRIAALPAVQEMAEGLPGEPGVGRPRWLVELWRCRGGEAARWEVEACDASGHVALAETLADRPAEADPARRAG